MAFFGDARSPFGKKTALENQGFMYGMYGSV